MPAPTKLSFDLQQTICTLVRAGNAPYIAARTVGIHHQTHYNWMQRGESGEGGYIEYFEAIKTAEADAEKELLEIIRQAALGVESVKRKEVHGPRGTELTEETQTKFSWQAAAWLLERRYPERWKNKELSTEDAIKVLAKALLSGDEEVARALRAAVNQASSIPSA